MNQPEEEDVSFEVQMPARSAESSGIDWLTSPAPENASGNILPGWLKIDMPDNIPVSVELESPTVRLKKRQLQNTAIVRRDVIEQDALSVSAPNISAATRAVIDLSCRAPLVYGLVAKIELSRPAFQFKVEHELPKNVKLIDTRPKAAIAGNRVIWNFGRVDPGQEIKLNLIVEPDEGATLDPSEFAGFNATYNQSLYVQTPIVRPRLFGEFRPLREISLGAWETLHFDVKNTGNWPVRNLKVRCLLPGGLRFAEGASETAELDQLLPAESHRFEFRARALQGGAQKIRYEVSGSDGAATSAEQNVEVVSPALELTIVAETKAIVKQDVDCRIEFVNRGRSSTEAYQVDLTHSRHLEVAKLSSGSIDTARGVVAWSGLAIKPGDKISFPIRFRPIETGDASFKVVLRSTSGAGIEATHEVAVEFDEAMTVQMMEEFLANQDSESPSRPTAEKTSQKAAPAFQHIVFTLGGSDFAVPLDYVTEVCKPPKTTILPNVPVWLVGLANIRGDVVSMVDLNAFFEKTAEGNPAEKRVLVVRSRTTNMQTAFLVDKVRGLRGFESERISQPSIPAHGGEAAFTNGQTRSEGREISIVDVEKLLNSRKMRRFDDE